MNFPPIVRAEREKRATGDASHLERRNTKFCSGLTPNSQKKKKNASTVAFDTQNASESAGVIIMLIQG
jgi:hypothetical protein